MPKDLTLTTLRLPGSYNGVMKRAPWKLDQEGGVKGLQLTVSHVIAVLRAGESERPERSVFSPDMYSIEPV